MPLADVRLVVMVLCPPGYEHTHMTPASDVEAATQAAPTRPTALEPGLTPLIKKDDGPEGMMGGCGVSLQHEIRDLLVIRFRAA